MEAGPISGSARPQRAASARPSRKARGAFPRRRKSCCALRTVEREESMPAERFDFPNAHGQKLAALLDCPAGEPRAYALFAHCFTCGKDIHAAKRVAEALTAL